MKLGADATAVAGPTGAKAVAANDPNVDVLTYSRAKGGLFAGASIASASMDTDDDANKAVYGKDITATQIVRDGAVTNNASGKALDSVLTKASPKRIQSISSPPTGPENCLFSIRRGSFFGRSRLFP